MDTTPLRTAYSTLLEAAATDTRAPADGEWTADQITQGDCRPLEQRFQQCNRCRSR